MKTKTKMSLSAHSVQRDPAESSLCSLRPGVLQRCEQDLWSLSKHMAQTLSDLTVVSLVSRDCFKEQGGVLTSLCFDCPCEGFYLKSSTMLSQKSTETWDHIDPDVACLVPKQSPAVWST